MKLKREKTNSLQCPGGLGGPYGSPASTVTCADEDNQMLGDCVRLVDYMFQVPLCARSIVGK